MQGDRNKRLSRQIQREINNIIRRDFNIPSNIILTVTGVSLAKDYKNCTIFFSVFTHEAWQMKRAEEKIFRMLNLKASYFKFVIGKNMRIKKIPDISFEVDTTSARAAGLVKIFDEIAMEKKSTDEE